MFVWTLGTASVSSGAKNPSVGQAITGVRSKAMASSAGHGMRCDQARACSAAEI